MSIEVIILIWALVTFVSQLLMIIGILRCATHYGWEYSISKKDNEFFLKTTLIILFVPGWNLLRTLKFAINPLKYVH